VELRGDLRLPLFPLSHLVPARFGEIAVIVGENEGCQKCKDGLSRLPGDAKRVVSLKSVDFRCRQIVCCLRMLKVAFTKASYESSICLSRLFFREGSM